MFTGEVVVSATTAPPVLKEQIMAKIDVDAVAAVIDNHTGKVRARFEGFGAETDAHAFLRSCQGPAGGGVKVDFLSSASVITGEKAKKAIGAGRT